MKARPEGLAEGGEAEFYGVNRLQADEPAKYGDAGVQEMDAQQAAIERRRAALSGRPIDATEADRRVAAEKVGLNVNPATGGLYYRGIDPRRQEPLSVDDTKRYIAMNYPQIARVAAESGLSEGDVLKTINFTLAYDAAKQIAMTGDTMRQAQIFNTMGPDMQQAVVDILGGFVEEAQSKQQQIADDSNGNMVLDAGATVWNWTLGPVFDTLWDANMKGVQALTAVGWMSSGLNPVEAWNKSAPGTLDPSMVAQARKTYGDRRVDLILEVQSVKDVEDGVGELYAKYSEANDLEALQILDNMLFGIQSDQATQDAISYLASADTGNLGNLFFWSMVTNLDRGNILENGPEWAQSPLYVPIRDTANIFGTFAADPTLLFGKVAGAYKGLRYGMHMLAPGKIDKAFANPNVRRFWDTLGEGMLRADAAADGAEKAQILNSLRSQYKQWFNRGHVEGAPDGIDLLYQAGVRNADEARQFFDSAESLRVLLNGQTARRSYQFQVPHMTQATARVKRWSLTARGLTYDRNAAAKIDEIFGPDVSKMLPDEAIPIIIKKLSEPGGDAFVGRMLSDFVYADDQAKRTFLGKIMGKVATPDFSGDGLSRWSARYGWKRKGGVRRMAERWSRMMAHYPDVARGGLTVADGSDAVVVRDMLLFAGMPKFWADYASEAWRAIPEAERVRFGSAIGRSMAYSLGVDMVDPTNGRAIINDMMHGLKQHELYAPDWQNVVALRGQAQRKVATAHKAEAEQIAAAYRATGQVPDGVTATTSKRGVVTLTDPNGMVVKINTKGAVSVVKTPAYRAAYRAQVQAEVEALKGTAPWSNPSKTLDKAAGPTGGLYYSQMSPKIAMPNIRVMDQMSMRQSYLTALLGTNQAFSSIVDLWTLGTLAGPRFQIRNGIEDMGMYAITGGRWKGYRLGQAWSRGKREATARPRRRAKDPVEGEKLGVGLTASRWLGDHAPKALQGWLHPHLDSADIAAASRAAAEGDRDLLMALQRKAIMRQRLLHLPFNDYRDAQSMKWIDEAAQHPMFYHLSDDVAESSRHLSDGLMPGMEDRFEQVIVDGQVLKMHTISRQFDTLQVRAGDPQAYDAWWNNLSMVLHGDRGKGKKAVSMVRRYHAAVASGSRKRVDDLVDEFAEWIEDSAPWVAERSQIAALEGVREFAKRNLDDVLRLFTTKSGGFNIDVYSKIKRVDVDDVTGETRVTYALWDEVPGGDPVYRLGKRDLMQSRGVPLTLLERDGIKVPVAEDAVAEMGKGRYFIKQGAWNMMGRSLARLTREPLYIANYMDARQLIAPVEARLAAQMGPEAASKWAVEAAAERAFAVTFSYVDNPAVRSQLAWQVRNVARFYRAQEDFYRRMVRVTKYNPAAFQRLNLAWHVLDDTGWISEDEYGDKFFNWPGSRYAFDMISKLVGAPGGTLPLQFSSKLTMITPSADPNALFPTFSSPVTSVGLGLLMQFTPGLRGLQNELLGEYAEGKAVWEQVIPSNIMRPLQFVLAASQSDGRWGTTDGTFASVSRATIQAAAAAGWWDEGTDLSAKQMRDIRSWIDTASMDIMAMHVLLAPSAFAALSISQDNVTDFARSVGVDGMRELFLQLLRQHEGDMSAAYVDWMKTNPGKSVFTVSKNTDAEFVGNYQPFKETVQFLESNPDLFAQHPEGAAFFAPQAGVQNLSAWNYLVALGAKVPKTVERYFNETLTATGNAELLIAKKQRQDLLAEGQDSKQVDDWYSQTREWIFATYPMTESRVSGELSTSQFSSAGDYERWIEDVRGAARKMWDTKQQLKRVDDAAYVIGSYDAARDELGQMSRQDPDYSKHREDVRKRWLSLMLDVRDYYPDDRQWEALLFATSGALGFKSAWEVVR